MTYLYFLSAALGCSGSRTCLLTNPYSSSSSSYTASASGPTVTDTVKSYSGNNVVAASGMYLQDYYFDSLCPNQGIAYLDENNGHDHDSYGYHYHITSTFPYTAGPKFKGCLSSSTCCGSQSSALSGTGCTSVPSCSPLSAPSPASSPSTPATSSYTCSVPTFAPSPAPSVIPTLYPTYKHVDYGCLHTSSWVLNGGTSTIFNNAMTDISISTITNEASTIASNWSVTFYRIPNYLRTLSSQDISLLNSRPKKATDFVNGKPSVVAFAKVPFGKSIGYSSSPCNLGYFPPNVSCPVSTKTTVLFPLNPNVESTSSGCYTQSKSPIGYWVNGVAIYSPASGSSYNNLDKWHYLSPVLNQYDVDICLGSVDSSTGQYYHRTYSSCLKNRLGEIFGSGHSPIYGWMNDGIPVYGPYNGATVRAQSCWVKNTTISPGRPSVSTTVYSSSGNAVSAAFGLFFEDYYFNTSCFNTYDSSSPNLDYNNGHSHGTYGYHYHVTIDSSWNPVFPYVIGPKYKGCLKNNPKTCCSSQANAFNAQCR